MDVMNHLWALECEHEAESWVKRIGPRLSRHPITTRKVPAPIAPLDCTLGESKGPRSRAVEMGQDRGGQWGWGSGNCAGDFCA